MSLPLDPPAPGSNLGPGPHYRVVWGAADQSVNTTLGDKVYLLEGKTNWGILETTCTKIRERDREKSGEKKSAIGLASVKLQLSFGNISSQEPIKLGPGWL